MSTNHETEIAWQWVSNEQPIRGVVLLGLFVAARRFLGYSPRGSSYPFITSTECVVLERDKQRLYDRQTGNGCVVIDAPYLKGNYKHYWFGLRLHDIFTNRVFDPIARQHMPSFVEWTGWEGIDYTKLGVAEVEIVRFALDEWWERMVEYAKTHKTFNVNEF